MTTRDKLDSTFAAQCKEGGCQFLSQAYEIQAADKRADDAEALARGCEINLGTLRPKLADCESALRKAEDRIATDEQTIIDLTRENVRLKRENNELKRVAFNAEISMRKVGAPSHIEDGNDSDSLGFTEQVGTLCDMYERAKARVRELEDQFYSACEEIKRTEAVHTWCSFEEANKWPEGSHVLECVLRGDGTVYEYRGSKYWRPDRSEQYDRDSRYALINAPELPSLKTARDTFLTINRAQAAEARVKELTEENKRLDKTICELEMDLDAARKRCHFAIETKKAEGNP